MEPYLRKVRYWDVDANGHVFNTRYLVYVDDALTDFLEESGLAFQEHEGDGFLMVIAHTSIDYRSEAVIGDNLATSIAVDRIGNTSIVFTFEIVEIGANRLVAAGEEVYVTVDLTDRRPIRVPDPVRDLLS
jgi:acyl-CoA thioester hydrolase